MKLQNAIRDLGLKQAFVADKLGIRKDSFSRMASGHTRFPVEKTEALAEILGLSIPETLRLVSVPLPPYAPPDAESVPGPTNN